MKNFCLEVWGDFACFTRPEMKVERVSYDVITPSSVRAIFEASLWKPAIRWHVHKIEVLEPIRWVNVRRNEVGKVIPKINPRSATKSNHNDNWLLLSILGCLCGTGGRTRTGTAARPMDFESIVSTNSTTPAWTIGLIQRRSEALSGAWFLSRRVAFRRFILRSVPETARIYPYDR